MENEFPPENLIDKFFTEEFPRVEENIKAWFADLKLDEEEDDQERKKEIRKAVKAEKNFAKRVIAFYQQQSPDTLMFWDIDGTMGIINDYSEKWRTRFVLDQLQKYLKANFSNKNGILSDRPLAEIQTFHDPYEFFSRNQLISMEKYILTERKDPVEAFIEGAHEKLEAILGNGVLGKNAQSKFEDLPLSGKAKFAFIMGLEDRGVTARVIDDMNFLTILGPRALIVEAERPLYINLHKK